MPNQNITVSSENFRKIARLIYDHSGIHLKENKKTLLRSRLRKRLSELGMTDLGTYYDYIRQDESGEELFFLLQAISTNVTRFFREEKHFEFLRETALPELTDRYARSSERSYIHLWSAACSTGQEPYSMAITILEELSDPRKYNMKLLATDLSKKALQEARRGVYDREDVDKLNPVVVDRYFHRRTEQGDRKVEVKDPLRDLVRFGMHNLNERRWPFSRKFDVIFCRNVMIYFDKSTVESLINRFARYMKPGAYLCVGHSESLAGIDHSLEYVQPTIYQKS